MEFILHLKIDVSNQYGKSIRGTVYLEDRLYLFKKNPS